MLGSMSTIISLHDIELQTRRLNPGNWLYFAYFIERRKTSHNYNYHLPSLFFQQQHIPLLSHHSLTNPAPTSRSSSMAPSPSMFSHAAKSSRMIGSYMRIFSCQLGRVRPEDIERRWARTALVICAARSGRLVRLDGSVLEERVGL